MFARSSLLTRPKSKNQLHKRPPIGRQSDGMRRCCRAENPFGCVTPNVFNRFNFWKAMSLAIRYLVNRALVAPAGAGLQG